MATDAFRTPSRSRYRVARPPQPVEPADRAHSWTASRCQRLLRPLLSRVALLRKELASPTSAATGAAASSAVQEATGKRPMAEGRALVLPRKKLRHTYSRRWAERPSRSGSSDAFSDDGGAARPEGSRFKVARDLQRDDATGEVVAFTPLLRRARGHEVSSPVQPSVSSSAQTQAQTDRQPPAAARRKRGAVTGHADLEQRMSLLRAEASSPAVYASYEAIYRSLEALLEAASPERPARTGASSLLDMCLAKIPQYIAGVQAWEVHEAERSGTKSATTGSDVSLRLYSELESLSTSGKGWAHLRAAARADALAVITGAVAEELFADEFTMLLIDLCARYAEARELNGLLEVFVSRQYPEPLSAQSVFAESGLLQPLSFLRDLSVQTNHKHLLLQHFSALLQQGLLPHTWLATSEFESIWAFAYRVVSRGESALDAVDFLATSITLLCKYQGSNRKHSSQDSKAEIFSSCQRAFIGALSVLSAMRRSGEGVVQVGSGSAVGLRKVTRISRNINFALHACIAEVESWRGRRGKPRDLLNLAVFLSSPEPQGGRVDVSVTRAFEAAYSGHKTGGGVPKKHIDDTIISLISSVAQICPRGTTRASRDYLQGILRQLGSLGLDEAVLQDITRAGAFSLAQQTNDLRDLLYAEQLVSDSLASSVDDTMTIGDSRHQLTQRRTFFDGFRWDETISEWVTVSPTAQKKNPRRRSAVSVPTRSSGRTRPDVARSEAGSLVSPAGTAPLTSLVADPPARQGSSIGPTVEASEQNPRASKRGQTKAPPCKILGLRDRGTPAQRGRDGTDGSSAARQLAWRTTARFHDELAGEADDDDDDDDDDKENRSISWQTSKVRKRHSDGAVHKSTKTRALPPASARRRIRMSAGEAAGTHSDDELAL